MRASPYDAKWEKGLPADLSQEQKESLKQLQQDLIKSNLEKANQRKGALMDKLSQFHTNNNPGKVRFYQSKLDDCIKEIEKLENLLK